MNVHGYTESGSIRIEIDGAEMFVPDDMANRHRAMIAEWEAAGNTIPPYAVDIDALKTRLITQVDADAEATRLKFITPGAGQAMTYQQKAAEATACLADLDPDPSDYPLLAAEIGITGETLGDVAAVVNGQYQAWRVIGAQIEVARLGAKALITAAATAQEAQAAYDAIVWPEPPAA